MKAEREKAIEGIRRGELRTYGEIARVTGWTPGYAAKYVRSLLIENGERPKHGGSRSRGVEGNLITLLRDYLIQGTDS